MKTFSTFVIICFSVALLIGNCQKTEAQSLKIIGDSIQIYKSNCLKLAEYIVPVKNISNIPVKVRVRKEHISITPKHEVYFCWVSCYNSSVFNSPKPGSSEPTPEIPAGKDTNIFHAYVDPRLYDNLDNLIGGQEGVSEARYHFYNEEDENDQATVVIRVEVSCSMGGADDQTIKYSAKVLPNPADEHAKITFAERLPIGTATLQVFDALGKKYTTTALNSGDQEAIVATSALPTGVYSYSVISDRGILYSRGTFTVAR
ncbi:MAG: T9SS type A sorting domain-containing protein [Bacteroidetes bacterium]|nr:T9SS type A sorting domain-containing protein [Bacteroidota bacterium]